jgi:hypothetical protein
MTFDGGIIHGTTQWERGPTTDHWTLGKSCPDCGRPISNNAVRCKPCNRHRQENRKRFKRRAAKLTPEDIEALTAAQMASVRARLDVRRETR